MSLANGSTAHLPCGWRLAKLDDLKVAARYSFVGGPFGSNLTRSDYVSMPGVPVIRGTNLGGNTCQFVDDDFVYVTEEKANSLLQNLAYPGDLVFTQRGTLGQVVEIPRTASFERYVVSQSQMKLAVDESKAIPRYVYYYCRSPRAVTYLNQRIQATGVPHINLEILKDFPIVLPPIEQQRRIAAILDKADAIRRKREEGIRLTEELLRSTFLEMFGDPENNPKGWRKVPFVTLLKTGMRNGISPSSEGTLSGKVLVLSAITGAAFDSDQVKEARFISPFTTDQFVSPQDFLICRGNGNKSLVGCGRFPTVSLHDTVFPDTMIAAGVDPDEVNSVFLERLWSTDCVRRQIENGARTTNGTFKINQKVLAAIEIPVPPMSEQKRYASVTAKVGLAQRQASKELSETLFGSLVQRAFRGEL